MINYIGGNFIMVKRIYEGNDNLDIDTKSYQERCDEYNDYLDNHINNVILAFELCDKDRLKELTEYNDEDLINIKEQIECHDQSKYEEEEWEPYLNWFYPIDENASKDEYGYDIAWIHHCHNNPHHFQYWICIDDDGTTRPIDMRGWLSLFRVPSHCCPIPIRHWFGHCGTSVPPASFCPQGWSYHGQRGQ